MFSKTNCVYSYVGPWRQVMWEVKRLTRMMNENKASDFLLDYIVIELKNSMVHHMCKHQPKRIWFLLYKRLNNICASSHTPVTL